MFPRSAVRRWGLYFWIRKVTILTCSGESNLNFLLIVHLSWASTFLKLDHEASLMCINNRYTSALETQRRGLFLHLFLVANQAECLVYPWQADHLEGWNSASWHLICSVSILKHLFKTINTPLLFTNYWNNPYIVKSKVLWWLIKNLNIILISCGV